jgi:hypothetical protein
MLAQGLRVSSGNFAMFAAMRQASSRVNSLAADRRPGSSSKLDVCERLPVGVTDYKARVRFLDGPGRREAALGHGSLEA